MKKSDLRLEMLLVQLERRQAQLYERLLARMRIREDREDSIAIRGVTRALIEDELRFVEKAIAIVQAHPDRMH